MTFWYFTFYPKTFSLSFFFFFFILFCWIEISHFKISAKSHLSITNTKVTHNVNACLLCLRPLAPITNGDLLQIMASRSIKLFFSTNVVATFFLEIFLIIYFFIYCLIFQVTNSLENFSFVTKSSTEIIDLIQSWN